MDDDTMKRIIIQVDPANAKSMEQLREGCGFLYELGGQIG